MLKIEDYYGVDEVIDLEVWKRKFNIPPREMAPKSGSQTALSLQVPSWGLGLIA